MRKPAWLGLAALLLAIIMLGAGCRPGQQPPEGQGQSPTLTAFSSASTPSRLATIPPKQLTSTPSLSPTATPSPTPVCWQARVRRAVWQGATPPLVAGASLQVVWEIENTGSCPWPTPLELRPQGEAPEEWEAEILAPEGLVPPGGRVQVRLSLLTQVQESPRFWRWTLYTAEGQTLPLQPPALTLALPPVLTPTPTFAIPILVQRQVTLTHNQNLNFDDGFPDIIYYAFGPGNQSLVHIERKMRIAPVYEWPPDYYTCRNLPYGERNAIDQPQYKIGTTYCYRTNEGRYGALRIDSVYEVNGQWYIVLTFFTWDWP